jgi:hypothetical protein
MSERLDYSRWLRKVVWRLDEAAALLLRINPKNIPTYPLRHDEYEDLLDTASRAAVHGQLAVERWPMGYGDEYHDVKPLVFLKWAMKSGYFIPEELFNLLDLSGTDDATNHAGNLESDSSSSGSKKKVSRKRRITTAIERAREGYLERNSREPTSDEIFSLLAENDETGCVVDYKDDALTWQDMSGEFHEITRKTLANRLSEIKKRE